MVGAALCTADFFLEFSTCYLEELAEEALDSTKYLLQLALSVGVRIEWIDRWHDGVQLQTTLWHVTSLPGGLNELLGGTFLQVLLAHDALKLLALLCIHVFLPFVGNLAIRSQTSINCTGLTVPPCTKLVAIFQIKLPSSLFNSSVRGLILILSAIKS